MFATLLGALPPPALGAGEEGSLGAPRPGHASPAGGAVVAAIRAQEAAGLEPITDGRLTDPGFERLSKLLVGSTASPEATTSVLERWQATAAATERATKQALPGPVSLAHRVGGGATARSRDRSATAAADALGAVVAALADAGCPLVELEEPNPERLVDEAELRRFVDAHRRLAEASGGRAIHRSLSFTGGAVPKQAIDAILDLPYASFAVDLIAGPDNWYLVRRAGPERGIVAGVLSAGEVDEAREVMHWGAHHAASGAGRGMDRVGLGSAGSWAALSWEAAVRKMEHLAAAARLAAMPRGEELARSLDPRAVSSRRAALGHGMPRRRRAR